MKSYDKMTKRELLELIERLKSEKYGEKTPQEMQIFIHELGVQKEKLQSQNRNLRANQQKLEETVNRYAGLYGFALAGDVTGQRPGDKEYEIILRTAMDGFWITDMEGHFLDVNEAYCHLTGYTKDELLKMSISDLEAAETPEETARHIQRVQEIGHDRFGTRHRCKDGRIVNVEISVNYLKGDKGRFFVFLRDITERKRAQENIIKELDLARGVINSLPGIFYLFSDKGEMVRWNDNLEEISGYSTEEILRMIPLDFIAAEDRKQVTDKIQEVFVMGRSVVDANLMTKRGQKIPYLFTGLRISIDGTLYIMGVGIDISERKRAESERDLLLDLSFAIRDAEDFPSALKIAIQRICEITGWVFGEVWLPNQGGTILVFADIWHSNNEDAARFAEVSKRFNFLPGIGLPGRIWASKKSEWLKDVSINGKIYARAEDAMKIGLKAGFGVPILQGDKVLAILAFYMSAPREEDEHLVQFVSSVASQLGSVIQRKIMEEALGKSEEKFRNLCEELEERVKERTQELEESKLIADAANRAKSDFLSNMSHELRTPLNSIVGFSELMRDGMAGTLTDTQKDFLNDIWESGKHLLRLINDILDLSKIESGKTELELNEFSPVELLKGSLVLFSEKTMKHRISLSMDVPEDIGSIIADEMKIKQVVLNLLGNALKFTPAGGTVTLRARKVPSSQFPGHHEEISRELSTVNREHLDSLVVSVEDTGIGIAKEDMSRLFKPFQQLEATATKRFEGTGLGLNISKKLVELHNGRIWVESELGKGSRFFFEIPERSK